MLCLLVNTLEKNFMKVRCIGWVSRAAGFYATCSCLLKLFLYVNLISGPGEVQTAPFLCPVWPTWPIISETDGPGMCLYMFRGQARPAQQGSSSHQRLTSTSSSGHVQRHNPCLLAVIASELAQVARRNNCAQALKSARICLNIR